MALYEAIQAAATDSSIPLADLLRKCAVLASRLKNDDFKKWVDGELNGYSDGEVLPPYRILSVDSFGNFSGPAGSGLNNAPIPPHTVKKELRHHVMEARIAQSVAALEDLVASGENGFQVPWPPDLTVLVGQDVYQHLNCLQAWRSISRSQMVGILDTVRNRVLAFVLEIESELPDAGEWPSSAPQPADSQGTVQRVFATTIAGNVGQFISGSHDFTANSIQVEPGDFESLATALRAVGLADTDVSDLQQAVTDDEPREDKKSLGPAVQAWIGKMAAKASTGAFKIAAGAALGEITKLILAHYGLAG